MARYIDADALKELIDGGYDIDFDEVPETKKALLNMIDYQETADVRENIHGRWNTDKESSEYATCSVCGHCDWDCTESEYFKFCPNCGALMDERRKDE